MPRVFFSSIRFKVFLLYFLILLFTLTLFNVLVYLNFSDTLERKVDSLLDAKLQAVEGIVRTYREVKAQTAEKSTTDWWTELFGGSQKEPGKEDTYDVLMRYLGYEVLAPDDSDLKILIDFFDPQGNLVNTSRPDSNLMRLDREILSKVLAGERVFYNFSMTLKKGAVVPVRAAAKTIKIDNDIWNIVQVRVPVKFMHDQLRGLLIQLLLRGIIVVIIASSGSFFIVKSTLRPVDQMTRTIRHVKPDTLDQRIQVPRTDDEIARLAQTFNAMLERLEKSFLSQTQIVQDISHELKTPLTIVRGQIEVILKKKRTPAEYEEMLQSSLEEIERLRRIIDNLLILAKFDHPGNAMEMKMIDLTQLLEKLIQDIRLLGAEKDLTVSLVTEDKLSVYGNESNLDRLFRNLLENAVKYNVPHGRIHLVAASVRNLVKVTIEDTGIGIPAHEISKIFDRFYRVDRARSSGEGFGLGLSICQSIVVAHHGQIHVKSDVGKGTTLSVSLPATAFDHFLTV